MKSYLYKIRKRFKSGTRIYIYPTLRCNLSCEYCTCKFDSFPDYNEIDLFDWCNIINRINGVNEIVLTGGEPTLYKEFNNLGNYILNHGYFLMVYTNFVFTKTITLYPRNRVFIVASYHRGMTETQKEIWNNNYNKYKNRYRIKVESLRDSKRILSKEEEYNNCYHKQRISYAPNGMGFASLYEMIK